MLSSRALAGGGPHRATLAPFVRVSASVVPPVVLHAPLQVARGTECRLLVVDAGLVARSGQKREELERTEQPTARAFSECQRRDCPYAAVQLSGVVETSHAPLP